MGDLHSLALPTTPAAGRTFFRNVLVLGVQTCGAHGGNASPKCQCQTRARALGTRPPPCTTPNRKRDTPRDPDDVITQGSYGRGDGFSMARLLPLYCHHCIRHTRPRTSSQKPGFWVHTFCHYFLGFAFGVAVTYRTREQYGLRMSADSWSLPRAPPCGDPMSHFLEPPVVPGTILGTVENLRS